MGHFLEILENYNSIHDRIMTCNLGVYMQTSITNFDALHVPKSNINVFHLSCSSICCLYQPILRSSYQSMYIFWISIAWQMFAKLFKWALIGNLNKFNCNFFRTVSLLLTNFSSRWAPINYQLHLFSLFFTLLIISKLRNVITNYDLIDISMIWELLIHLNNILYSMHSHMEGCFKYNSSAIYSLHIHSALYQF